MSDVKVTTRTETTRTQTVNLTVEEVGQILRDHLHLPKGDVVFNTSSYGYVHSVTITQAIVEVYEE